MVSLQGQEPGRAPVLLHSAIKGVCLQQAGSRALPHSLPSACGKQPRLLPGPTLPSLQDSAFFLLFDGRGTVPKLPRSKGWSVACFGNLS